MVALEIVFGYMIGPFSTVTTILVTLFIRSNEFQADRFAVKQGNAEALCSALL